MSVYVDNANLPFGRMRMCHMIADAHEELVGMAQTIGVDAKWIMMLYSVYLQFELFCFLTEKRNGFPRHESLSGIADRNGS